MFVDSIFLHFSPISFFILYNSSVWGGPRSRKGTLITARTYTDGTVFHNSDTENYFPDYIFKTRDNDAHFLSSHGITDTCPSMKVYNNNEELSISVKVDKHGTLKLLMSCHCKFYLNHSL